MSDISSTKTALSILLSVSRLVFVSTLPVNEKTRSCEYYIEDALLCEGTVQITRLKELEGLLKWSA